MFGTKTPTVRSDEKFCYCCSVGHNRLRKISRVCRAGVSPQTKGFLFHGMERKLGIIVSCFSAGEIRLALLAPADRKDWLCSLLPSIFLSSPPNDGCVYCIVKSTESRESHLGGWGGNSAVWSGAGLA